MLLENDSKCFEKKCGNNILNTGEECDDSNIIPGDGCSNNCTLEVIQGINCTKSASTDPNTCYKCQTCFNCSDNCSECNGTNAA